jgi:Tol biopolymer transport system component
MKKSLHAEFAVSVRWLLAACILATLLSPEVFSQYFGRNKVQYDRFNFHYIETEHFEIYYYPEKEEAIMDIGRMAERWYHRLSQLFNHEFEVRKPIIFYADDADFHQTNVIGTFIGEGTGGVTEGMKNRIVMPMAGNYADTDHVLGHELVHVFQFDIATRDTARFNMGGIPLWFIEGMAEYLTLGHDNPQTAMWLRDALEADRFPTVRRMTREPQRYFPYRFGHAFWAYVGGTYGDDVIPAMYRHAGRVGVEQAIRRVLGVSADSLSAMWREQVQNEYEQFMEGRVRPREIGDRILARDIDAGEMNIGPSLSPDGRHVVFLSERDLFSIDLFLADAHTGEVLKRLVSATTDPHFDSLRFINSAGAWSPDGTQLAFVVFQEGENRIALMDVETRQITTRMQVAGVGTVSNLSWSPDGGTIAFSGMFGGVSNLYLIDIETRAVRQLTDDRYAAIHPTWSPDGGTIAYVTDYTEATDFSRLTYDRMQIAFYDVATGAIERLSVFDNTLHTNPQYSPDGSFLYFIASPDGYSNIYRIELESDRLERITNVLTGITGITPLSPALTVARESDRIMFAVFEGGRYAVYALNGDEIEGEAIEDVEAIYETYAGILPPSADHAGTAVNRYLADIDGGLPATTVFASENYRPRLGLDFIGSVGAGVAVTPFGTGLMGGASLFFTDMLGNHNLLTGLQVLGTWRDIGGVVAYQNLTRRMNWGASLSRVPNIWVRSGLFSAEDADFMLVTRIIRMYDNSAFVFGSYPLSMTRRVELGGGYTRVGYFIEEEQTRYIGGFPVSFDRVRVDSPSGLDLYRSSAAYVGDNSFFGFTSPVRGQRYRLEAGGTTGSLDYYTLLADYRRYEMPVRPFTLAFRALHYGRYGGDADSDRLGAIFLGQPAFIRGYNIFSLSGEESLRIGRSLIGSRIAVMNLEARIPLFGVDRFGLINFPYLPTEISFFMDGGVAWTRNDEPTITFRRRPTENDHVPLFSTGISARFNVFGALIMEIYYAHPFQRPDRGAHFGFQLMPGW